MSLFSPFDVLLQTLATSLCCDSRKLLDFVIHQHFPSIGPDDPDKYLVIQVV